jgi:hypothetical protein
MSEAKIQSTCFIWTWNNYPQTRGLLCYNLGNSRNKIDGASNKAMGLIPGRSDMTFYWNKTAYFIEFKVPGQKQSISQTEWQNKVEKNGYKYYVIDSFEQFKETIHGIMR